AGAAKDPGATPRPCPAVAAPHRRCWRADAPGSSPPHAAPPPRCCPWRAGPDGSTRARCVDRSAHASARRAPERASFSPASLLAAPQRAPPVRRLLERHRRRARELQSNFAFGELEHVSARRRTTTASL